MNGGKTLTQIEITLRSDAGDLRPLYIDVYSSHLADRWLQALADIIERDLVLEKNYCFIGFEQSRRNGQYILDQVNRSINAINEANLGYQIHDYFSLENCLLPGDAVWDQPGQRPDQQHLNQLHRYFEDLQGVSGDISEFAKKAGAREKYHIRQLNLLCHEFESWALSHRKAQVAPDWRRPSQLMCWLNAPRFVLQPEDYELFGIDTINRSLGGVFVGVNKAVGKHHWEVFHDEGRNVSELTTTTLRSQTEAAGDFDIEWGINPGQYVWQQKLLQDFREWLEGNGFDPEDKSLTIGHPQVGQVNLEKSFDTTDHNKIWQILNHYLDVYQIHIDGRSAVYPYRWDDIDFESRQIQSILGVAP